MTNINQSVKILKSDDLNELMKKIISCNTKFYIANSKSSSMTMNKGDFLKYTLGMFTKPNHVIYGHYEDQDLKSIMTVEKLINLPSYIFKNYKRFETTNFFDGIKSGLDILSTTIMKDFESIGYYSYYLLQSVNNKNLNRNFNMRNSVKHFRDYYTYVIEEYVPANNLPKFSLHNEILFHNKTLPVDTVIGKIICKDNYRKFI